MEMTKMAYNLVNLTPFGFIKIAVGTYAAYHIAKKVSGYVIGQTLGSLVGFGVSIRTFSYLSANANPDLNNAQQEKLIQIFFSVAEQADEWLQKHNLKAAVFLSFK
ncbi:MAG TPA: hypothetical protein PLC42_03470 [Parachlamydiaceae bacterium]|nr:hypothetical protein [Parachlamydiaceae bacterium]